MAKQNAARDNTDLGRMPEWRLEHLYPSMGSKEYTADVSRAATESAAFAAAYRGKLEALV